MWPEYNTRGGKPWPLQGRQYENKDSIKCNTLKARVTDMHRYKFMGLLQPIMT